MILLKHVGQKVDPSQNEEIDKDMYFYQILVSSLKALSAKKNSLAREKTQNVLFELEFAENLD